MAALEGLLRLRRLTGEGIEITMVAPRDEFHVRALSVKEPFALGRPKHHSLERIAAANGAELVSDSLSWVDPNGRILHTDDGRELAYDALLIAVGARAAPAFEHVKCFSDARADAIFGGVVADIESGHTKRVAFLAPEGPTWLLPLYELALMTAERANSMGADDVELILATPEPWPLAGFGRVAGDAVARLMERAGITVCTSALAQVPAPCHLLVQPHGIDVRTDAMVSMPRLSGPAIRGLAGGGVDGFIPISRYCDVPGTNGRVFAAGDATAFPVKHGGLGARQADTAAAAIARLAGVDVDVDPFDAELRGKLLTGAEPLYLRARVIGGQAFESEVSGEPLWPDGEHSGKLFADELGAYLAGAEARP